MAEVIDLDVLVPPKVTIKFDQIQVEIKPPKTVDILRLGNLGQRMQSMSDLTPVELENLVVELTATVKACVPELSEKELTTQQLLKLVEIISGMAVPPDVKELEARGVTVGDPKVKSA